MDVSRVVLMRFNTFKYLLDCSHYYGVVKIICDEMAVVFSKSKGKGRTVPQLFLWLFEEWDAVYENEAWWNSGLTDECRDAMVNLRQAYMEAEESDGGN